ncbi:MAG: NUDIX hydrolase [Alphaproteobacteria bacterium]|nr:NUDIX hydrolase [Alphaproteobacteria bacterium]
MLSFETPSGLRFNFRVGGIALHDGNVLIHRDPADAYWTPPGGRVEAGETAAEALRREMHEETGFDVSVGRLLWIVENFFVWRGKPFHEILFYHLMDMPAAALAQPAFRGREGAIDLEFAWVDARAPGVNILPGFLRAALPALPLAPVHVVVRDIPKPG